MPKAYKNILILTFSNLFLAGEGNLTGLNNRKSLAPFSHMTGERPDLRKKINLRPEVTAKRSVSQVHLSRCLANVSHGLRQQS